MNTQKITIIGDGGVGKSKLTRLLHNPNYIFDDMYLATMGAEVFTARIYGDNHNIRLWDTAGIEKFQGLKEGYYIDTDLFLIVYDNNPITQYNIINWMRDAKNVCPNKPILIVRNKCDLLSKGLQHIDNEIKISCKNKSGIDNLISKITNLLS